MRYFVTGTPDISVYCANGAVVKWRRYAGSEEGWYSTDDPEEIKALENCIEKKIGGDIREATQAEFAEWQKKTAGSPVYRAEREHLEPSKGTSQRAATTATPHEAGAAEDEPEAANESTDAPRIVRGRATKK
jgi:hypothetical protein